MANFSFSCSFEKNGATLEVTPLPVLENPGSATAYIPRWLVPNVISNPSSVSVLFGNNATPALFISKSNRFSPGTSNSRVFT